MFNIRMLIHPFPKAWDVIIVRETGIWDLFPGE